VWVCSSQKGVCGISLRGGKEALERDLGSRRACDFRTDPEANRELMEQIQEYLTGGRKGFRVELDLWGTAFQIGVWGNLREIPYGETRSYGQVASSLGSPGAARAVGRAAGRNPVPIVVPCHRLIRGDGSLGGFGCGLDIKGFLLALEARASGGPRSKSQKRRGS